MSSRLPVLGEAPKPAPESNQTAFGGNVAIVTLGCAKNLVDSEVMLGSLVAKGFRSVPDPADADLIVVNTCAFLQSAVEEGLEKILEMTKYKQTGRCRQLIVAGCMVERYRGDLIRDLPEVDQFISTDELQDVARLTSTTEACLDDARRPYFLYDESMPRVRSTAKHTAFVKIAEGCDRPCTFCIIPKIRGPKRSRPPESVIAEARALLSEGVRELNLVAQDLTDYGTDLSSDGKRRPLLVELLRGLSAGSSVASEYWVRLLYAYPIGVTDELIKLVRDEPYIASYIDMPLQHISHPVLKSMRRPLGERGTRALIEQIRALAPDVALRTTFIAGFPGETEDDVEALANFIREGHFAHVGVFSYSQEKEAGSYTMADQIPSKERQARVKYLMEAQQELVLKRYADLVGKKLRVLVDGEHEESELLLAARAEWQAPETDGNVLITDVDESLLDAEGDLDHASVRGKFVNVEVTGVAGYDLLAKLLAD